MTYPSPIPSWPGLTHLTDAAPSQSIDLDEAVGQRQATFRFDLINGVNEMHLGQLHPVITPAVVSHDTTRTTKRQLQLQLGVADTAAINPLTDRVLPYMLLDSLAWPLGRFMFTADARSTSTGGARLSGTLLDEMFLVDQQISSGFPLVDSLTVQQGIYALVAGLPLPGVEVDNSPYVLVGAWAPGATRGQILSTMATIGDYQTPWMSSAGKFRMIRTVDAESATPTLDLDRGNRVIRNSPVTTSDLLTAPNRFVVVGNGGASQTGAIVGTYDLPPSAPHSIQNRGFVIPEVRNFQVADSEQAAAAARAIGLARTIVTTVELTTAPDPRHDSYDVVRWQGLNWLEVGWSLTCQEGAPMTHSLRRGFA